MIRWQIMKKPSERERKEKIALEKRIQELETTLQGRNHDSLDKDAHRIKYYHWKYCPACGFPNPAHLTWCSHCREVDISGATVIVEAEAVETVVGQKEKDASALWYLVALLFGLIGGLIGYVATKDKHPSSANGILALGIMSTVILVIIGFFLLLFGLI
jgi:hypothetical protein